MTSATPLKCRPPLKTAFERRPEKGSWFADCCYALLKSETFTIVGDNARASHYSTQCLFPYINSMFFLWVFLPSTIIPQSSSFLCLCLIVVFLLPSSDNSAVCIMCQLPTASQGDTAFCHSVELLICT